MIENILHYIWKYKKFNTVNLKTTARREIELVDVGTHNFNSGPDFLNALIKIDGQLWAGNVELHIRSTLWYLHGHDNDKAYDNVILHVVWEDDAQVQRMDKSVIPTLELKPYTPQDLISNYNKLIKGERNWINCEKDFSGIDDHIIDNWLDRLYHERLVSKCQHIDKLLASSQNDWEAVCFKCLATNFGLHINAEAFLSMANAIDFGIIRKIRSNLLSLEALFFGQSGLLEANYTSSYYDDLKREYRFLKKKFHLKNSHIAPPKFLRLRPINFPTIRLAHLAQLYHRETALFSIILNCRRKQDYYKLFSVNVSSYWTSHYNFNGRSRSQAKVLSKRYIDLIIINAIIPLKYSYSKMTGKPMNHELYDLINTIGYEINQTSQRFYQLKKLKKNAFFSQALLQLKNEYCDKNKCLECAIGNTLLNRNM